MFIYNVWGQVRSTPVLIDKPLQGTIVLIRMQGIVMVQGATDAMVTVVCQSSVMFDATTLPLPS